MLHVLQLLQILSVAAILKGSSSINTIMRVCFIQVEQHLDYYFFIAPVVTSDFTAWLAEE